MMKIFILLFFILSSEAFAADPPIQLYDEGILQGTIFRINCLGDDIVCTKNGITGIITVGTLSNGLQFLGVDLNFGGSALTFTP